nr:immunoglobulin heavy chain junction region [Macaca mulatta]MOV54085.1 immunoglobulin heavy chain junction region [Macaca mulatta]MOV54094.1 immunoglobulin heavy chain junction region [Macaca mulatta]MOV54528.1 immunoglobulin heavy chain junction region [Macaca mulatta]MOV55144.1 immunoglobulin heavy chain junction region [Macaca mulatta]
CARALPVEMTAAGQYFDYW